MTAEKQRREITELENLLAGSGDGSSAPDQTNPYAEVVQQMHQRMMAATGANPSETWMRKMIAHHRGGVAMSNVLFDLGGRSEEQTSELQSLMRISYAVFCLKK